MIFLQRCESIEAQRFLWRNKHIQNTNSLCSMLSGICNYKWICNKNWNKPWVLWSTLKLKTIHNRYCLTCSRRFPYNPYIRRKLLLKSSISLYISHLCGRAFNIVVVLGRGAIIKFNPLTKIYKRYTYRWNISK